MEKVINLEYGLLKSQKQLSRNLPSRNGNLEFYLKKTLGPPQTPGCVCGLVGVGLGGEGLVGGML